MRKCLLIASVTLLFALAQGQSRADETTEPPLAHAQTTDVVMEEGPMPDMVPTPGLVSVQPDGKCPCLKKFWDWLTYQPLQRPYKCKACKRTSYPCCPVHPYALFPCTTGGTPAVYPACCGGGAACASSGSCATCAAHP